MSLSYCEKIVQIISVDSVDNSESKQDFYRGEGSMKKLCADQQKHATEIINFEEKGYATPDRKTKKIQQTKRLPHIQLRI